MLLLVLLLLLLVQLHSRLPTHVGAFETNKFMMFFVKW
jgi:hypothetical protein